MSCVETTNLLSCVFEKIDVLAIIRSNPFTCSNNKEEDLRGFDFVTQTSEHPPGRLSGLRAPLILTPRWAPSAGWVFGGSHVGTPQPQRQINQRNRADLRSWDLKIF